MSRTSHAPFQPTSWSLVERTASGPEEERRRALEELAGRYWAPVYAYLRRRGRDPDAAADLVQSFFLYLMSGDLLGRADPERGRFRSFLLGVLRKFAANEARREEVRAGPRSPVDPARLEPFLAATTLGPERAFERIWALGVIERAVEGLAAELGPERWEAMRPHVVPQGGRPPAYRECAERLGLTEAAFTSALHRARKRLAERVREEAGDEVEDLLAALGDQK